MDLQAILPAYLPVSLEEMDGIRLMNRTDTKFVTSLDKLKLLLRYADADYRVQQVANERNLAYHTVYLDTPGCAMYLAHQNGRKVREKIRVRTYISSGLTFLEVKNKDNRGRTDKKRIPVDDIHSLQSGQVETFLQRHAWYSLSELDPQLENDFRRITLVNKAFTERLTIDTQVRFHNLNTGQSASLDNLAIIELKRDGRSHSPICELLRNLHVKPMGISKYCTGLALTTPTIKRNQFKPKLIAVNHIQR